MIPAEIKLIINLEAYVFVQTQNIKNKKKVNIELEIEKNPFQTITRRVHIHSLNLYHYHMQAHIGVLYGYLFPVVTQHSCVSLSRHIKHVCFGYMYMYFTHTNRFRMEFFFWECNLDIGKFSSVWKYYRKIIWRIISVVIVVLTVK